MPELSQLKTDVKYIKETNEHVAELVEALAKAYTNRFKRVESILKLQSAIILVFALIALYGLLK